MCGLEFQEQIRHRIGISSPHDLLLREEIHVVRVFMEPVVDESFLECDCCTDMLMRVINDAPPAEQGKAERAQSDRQKAEQEHEGPDPGGKCGE